MYRFFNKDNNMSSKIFPVSWFTKHNKVYIKYKMLLKKYYFTLGDFYLVIIIFSSKYYPPRYNINTHAC